MRHSYFGRKLSRTKNERRRLLVNLARELITRGTITTTLAKARAVQPVVEKLITKAKKHESASLRVVQRVLADKETAERLLNDAATRFANRKSGFTRLVKLGPRYGDASEQAILAFVDAKTPPHVALPKPEETEEPKKPKNEKQAKNIPKASKTKEKK